MKVPHYKKPLESDTMNNILHTLLTRPRNMPTVSTCISQYVESNNYHVSSQTCTEKGGEEYNVYSQLVFTTNIL